MKRPPQASAPFSSLSPVAGVEAGRGLLAVERDDGVGSSSGWFKGEGAAKGKRLGERRSGEMREGDQRWLVLWGLGMERPREGKVGACGSGRWRCSVAVGKEMGVEEKKRIPKPGRVAMEAG